MENNIINLSNEDKFNNARIETYLRDLSHDNPETLKIWKAKLIRLISLYAKTPDPTNGELKFNIPDNPTIEEVHQIEKQIEKYFNNYKKDVEKHIMSILSEYAKDLKTISELETVN